MLFNMRDNLCYYGGHRCRWRGWRGWCWRQKLLMLTLVCGLTYVALSWFRSGYCWKTGGFKAMRKATKDSEERIYVEENSKKKEFCLPSKNRAKVKPDTDQNGIDSWTPLSGERSHPIHRGGNLEELNGPLRMRKRQEILAQFCSTHSADNPSDKTVKNGIFRTNIIVSKHRPLLYCPVGKIASTFLTRFLVVAEETNPVESPFAVSSEKALRMRNKKTGNYILFASLNRMVQEVAGGNEREFLGDVSRVLFVRCPFHRLWSTYVDKLLFPNPYYWREWGYPAMSKSLGDQAVDALQAPSKGFHGQSPLKETGLAASSVECGQSVTFSQFIDFALSDLHQIDTHVRPVAWECEPCYLNYNVIGHVETLTSDVLHLVDLLHLNSSKLRSVNWEEELAKDTIKEAVKSLFVKRASEVRECMLMEEAGRRLWHVLQIRGLISEKMNFPPTLTENATNPPAIEAALLKAHSESTRMKDEIEQQRHTAFLSAYQGVSIQLKARIRKVYAADFKMFAFDDLPTL